MAKSDSLWRSIQKHPVFSGGDPDEAFLLDWMEAMLSVCGEETDFTVKSLASHLERHPERWPTFIEKSQKDPLAWEALQVLIARLDEKPPKIPVEDEAKWEAGRDALNRWARDAVKVGKEAHTKSVSRGRRSGQAGVAQQPYYHHDGRDSRLQRKASLRRLRRNAVSGLCCRATARDALPHRPCDLDEKPPYLAPAPEDGTSRAFYEGSTRARGLR